MAEPQQHVDRGEDHESAVSLLAMQLDNLNTLLSDLPEGQNNEDVDLRAVLLAQREEVESSLASTRDRALCISISKAVETDGPLISLAQAHELHQKPTDTHADEAEPTMQPAEDSDSHGSGQHVDVHPDRLIEHLWSYNIVPQPPLDEASAGTPTAELECSVCLEKNPATQSYNSPCGHVYCHVCLRRVFHEATLNGPYLEPYCCDTPIPLATVNTLVGPSILAKHQLATLEHSSTDRTYCANTHCASFIPPHLTHKTLATCHNCHHRTCILCKSTSHPGAVCDRTADDPILQLADQEGWRRCYQCRTLVELETGCYHMTYLLPLLLLFIRSHQTNTPQLPLRRGVLLPVRRPLADLRVPALHHPPKRHPPASMTAGSTSLGGSSAASASAGCRASSASAGGAGCVPAASAMWRFDGVEDARHESREGRNWEEGSRAVNCVGQGLKMADCVYIEHTIEQSRNNLQVWGHGSGSAPLTSLSGRQADA
ncbi:hypothetical protein FH972_021677 [Carpinus fangiana]|uniref:RBR-type E3 ubiquitin transferase n=1 Tax=Carpinus fangiana TaxID=176857 RepID=A0A5N6KQ03_9ROSI|nr:hypothetical protein FH972_021677 [Carpinus fangiana]